MRKIFSLLLLVSLLCDNLCSFACGEEMMAWPSGNKINCNGVIIISMKNFTAKKFYLKAGEHKVALHLTLWCNGGHHITQVMMIPKEKLNPHTEYFLVNDSSRVLTGLKTSHKAGPLSWTTTARSDELAPQVRKFPELKKSNNHININSSCSYEFAFKAKEDSEMYLSVISKSNSGESAQMQLVFAKRNSFILSMDTCRGGFIFLPGKKYVLTFQLVDASGNVQDLSEKPIEIIKED